MIAIKRKQFGRCRAKLRARDIGWRPIVLHWRKRRRQLTNMIVRRVETSTRVLSFPQFHFHFANQTYRSLTSISRGATSSTRIFNTQVIRAELRAKTKPTSLMESIGYQQTSAADPRNSLLHEQRAVGTLQISGLKSASANVVAPQRLTLSRYLLSQPRFRSRRQFAAKEEHALSFKTQSRFVQPHTPAWITVRARNINSAPEVMHRNKPVPPPHYSRTEELIWRRVAKTTSDIDELVRRQNVIDSSEPLFPSAPTQSTQIDPAPRSDAATAGLVTKLDPALMDRLANDVIRRMEKRVRIERERRGL